MLRQHPDVCFAQPKEVNFFQDNFHRGTAWYAQHFDAPAQSIQGEISPLYMDYPEVVERIADTYPSVTILAVLRNPYDRAISNLLHEIRGVEGGMASVTVERARKQSQQTDRYVRRSCYAMALAPYFERFSPSQITVLFYDDFVNDEREFLRALYRAVDAYSDFVPSDFHRVINKTQDYVSPTLFKMLRATSRAANSWALTRRGMEWLYRNTRLREQVLAVLAVDRGRPQFDFCEVFGHQAAERISRDVERLVSEFRIAVPDTWHVDSSGHSRREFAA